MNYLASSFAGASTGIVLSSALHTPVEDVVVLVPLADEQVPEEFTEVRVIRLVIESKSAAVVEEDAKLVGKAAAKKIRGRRHLLFHDTIVLLLLGRSLESLPGKSAAEEVHENVSKRLEIVAPGLFDAQVGVDRGVPSCAGEILVLAVRDVEVSLGVTKFLSQTEIYNIDLVATFADAHEEVVWFDVAVDEVAGVNVLDTRNLDG